MEGRTKFDEWYMNKEKNNWELLEVKILFFPPNYSKISHYQLIVIWRHQFQSRAQTIKYFTLSRNPVEKSLAFGGIRGEDTGAECRHKLGRYLYETRTGARRLYYGEVYPLAARDKARTSCNSREKLGMSYLPKRGSLKRFPSYLNA